MPAKPRCGLSSGRGRRRPGLGLQRRTHDLLPLTVSAVIPRATTRSLPPSSACCGPSVRRPSVAARSPSRPRWSRARTVRRLSWHKLAPSHAAKMVRTPAPSRRSHSTSKPRLVPAEPSQSEKAPDLRVLSGDVEIGAAWKRTSKDQNVYHAVKLDDPSFTAPSTPSS